MTKPSIRRCALACAAAGALGAAPAVAATSHHVVARRAATVLSTHTTRLGRVISDSAGRSLYVFSGRSCTGTCTRTWIPLIATGKLEVASRSGLNVRLMGRVRRGRSFQVTYRHKALYRFAGDRRPGQSKGEGDQQFGGYWYLLDGSGHELFVLSPTY